jgi:hypothetical protein
MAHASQRPDHTIDWDEIESRHRPVMLVSRPAYEGWILTLFGAVLLGLIALIRWGGYLLSIVKTELRQLKATVEHSTQGHPSEEAMSRRTPGRRNRCCHLARPVRA